MIGTKRKIFSISNEHQPSYEVNYSTTESEKLSVDLAGLHGTFDLKLYDSLQSKDAIEYRQMVKLQSSLLISSTAASTSAERKSSLLLPSAASSSETPTSTSTKETTTDLPPCKQAHLDLQRASLELDFLTEVLSSIRDKTYLSVAHVQTELDSNNIRHGPILALAQRLQRISTLYQGVAQSLSSATKKTVDEVEQRRKFISSLMVVKQHWDLSVVHHSNLAAVLGRRYSDAQDLIAVNCSVNPTSTTAVQPNSFLVPLVYNPQSGIKVLDNERHKKFAEHRTLNVRLITSDTREVIVSKNYWQLIKQFQLDAIYDIESQPNAEDSKGQRIHQFCYKRQHESIVTELFHILKEECNTYSRKLVVECLEKDATSEGKEVVAEKNLIDLCLHSRSKLVMVTLSEHKIEFELNSKLNVQFELVPLTKHSTSMNEDDRYPALTSFMDLIMLEMRLKLLQQIVGVKFASSPSSTVVQPNSGVTRSWQGKHHNSNEISLNKVIFTQDIVLQVFSSQCAALQVRRCLEFCQSTLRTLLPYTTFSVQETFSELLHEKTPKPLSLHIDNFHYQLIVDNDLVISVLFSSISLAALKCERFSDANTSKDLKVWRYKNADINYEYIGTVEDLQVAVMRAAISFLVR